MFMIFKANRLQLTTVNELNQARDGRSKILRAEEDSQQSPAFCISDSRNKMKRKNIIFCVIWRRQISKSTSSFSESVW